MDFFNRSIKNKKLVICLKLLVSIGIILIIVQKVDIKDLVKRLILVQWQYIVLCLFLLFLGEVLHSLRWGMLLKCKGIGVSFVKLLYFNFVGLFFNLSLPGAIGGDMSRMYQMSSHLQNTSEAVASVFMDRGIGFFTLLCISPIIVLFSAKEAGASVLFSPSILLVIFAVIAVFIVIRPKGLIQRWHLAACYYDVFDGYRSKKKIILFTMIISLAVIILNIIITFLISYGMGLYVSPVYFIIFVPIISLITMIPISMHGLGVREGAFVFFFAKAGLSAPDAISISLISYVLSLVFGLAGGMVYMLGSRQEPERTIL